MLTNVLGTTTPSRWAAEMAAWQAIRVLATSVLKADKLALLRLAQRVRPESRISLVFCSDVKRFSTSRSLRFSYRKHWMLEKTSTAIAMKTDICYLEFLDEIVDLGL